MTLSYKEVADIVKIIDASSCEEVILETEGTCLVVRRGDAADTIASPSVGATNLPSKAETQTSSPASAPTPAANAAPQVESANGETVNSPMVGTFYRRPSPDDAPFVDVGTRVAAGDALCMIEVMKLYTTLEARINGVVESILAEDGKLVEFDQPLFIIRAD